MNLLSYNSDIIFYIFNQIKKCKTAFNFRLINKLYNDIYKSYFHNLKINIIARSTYINIRECGVCYKLNTSFINFKQLIYKFDTYPRKCIIHCNNKKCYLSAIKKYLMDIHNNDIYPFCDISQKFLKQNYFIKKYYIENIKKIDNKWYIECEDIYSLKFYRVNNIDTLINYNLFPWFLNRKKI